MRFSEDNVDIPEKLISALIQKRLVIFIGAGLSAKAYPQQKSNTYYPTFKGLCEQIAVNLSLEISPEHEDLMKNGHYDRLLGIWNDAGENVHECAAKILSANEDKKRIVLHKAMVNIFQEDSEPRIVTSNFDSLLRIALSELMQEVPSLWRIYEAPALPPAGRFTGICYLHGCVSKPSEMILTDKDIGRAYMDEGWALKFAHELFKTFPVLFIGYSLSDPPLRYLSLALEGTEIGNTEKTIDKWAFIPEKKNLEEAKKDWIRRGIEPIIYPVRLDNHRALENTIKGWIGYNRRGFVSRRTDLYQLTKIPPAQLVPHQKDLVLSYLKEPELLRDLAEYDFNESWFDELLKLGYFDKLLKTNEQLNAEDISLANKLVKLIIENPVDWILKLTSHRKTLHPVLFEMFCRELDKHEEDDISSQTLRQILELFRPSLQNDLGVNYSYYLDKLFDMLFEYELYEDAIWLLVSLLDVEIIIKTSFVYHFSKLESDKKEIPKKLDSELDFKGQIQDQLFKRYFRKYFVPNLSQVGYSLLIELTTEFRNLLMAKERIEPITFTNYRRPHIQKGKDYYSHTVIDLFLDTLLEIWESLLENRTDQAILVYQNWKQIDNPYYNRITLYALTKLLEVGYVR